MSVEAELLPRVVDILDRLDAQPLPATPPLAHRLTDAVTQVCVSQGLTPTPAAIEAAVQAHLAEGPLAPPTTPRKGWGWNRPASEAERARRAKGNGWINLLRAMGRSEGCGAFLVGLSLISGIVSGVAVGHWIPSTGWGIAGGLLTAFLVSILAVFGTLGVCLESADNEAKLKKVIPDEETTQRWLKVEAARHGVRQCLSSELPCFMQGDVEHLNALASDEQKREAARQAQAEKDEQRKLDEARMEDIRRQFHPQTPSAS